MQMKKCEKGHWYDGNKYNFCPHCSNMTDYEEMDRTVATSIGNGYDNTPTEAIMQNINLQKEMNELTEPLTQEPQPAWNPQNKMDAQSNLQPGWNLQNKIADLQEEEQDLTVGYYSEKMKVNPVVGWLICLNGDNRGRSYEIKSGRNFVGRSADMDIVLEGDQTVSRKKHAILVYDAKSGKFIAQPGESRELFYVNDEVVLSNVELNSYDELLVGKTQLMFMALCSEKFNWEE